jgi:phospholipid N-methyltransferase
MNLYNLVKLKNQLKSVKLEKIDFEVDVVKNLIEDTKNIQPSYDVIQTHIVDLTDSVEKTKTDIVNVDKKISEFIEVVDDYIERMTRNFHARGYVVNDFVACDMTDVEGERRRLLPVSLELKSELIVKIRSYTEWHYPTLEIGPGDGEWTDHLIGGDPLYLVDQYQEFIDSTLSRFNPAYRGRVRPYLIGVGSGNTPTAENMSDTDLSQLPKNQIGFIFSWNVFNYFPLKHVQSYLAQCYDVLRPGGVMMFSYNNCEDVNCAIFAEMGYRSWMPESLLIKTCKEQGFEIINSVNKDESIHWVEIKKPGHIKTVKGHQVLGEIRSTGT